MTLENFLFSLFTIAPGLMALICFRPKPRLIIAFSLFSTSSRKVWLMLEQVFCIC